MDEKEQDPGLDGLCIGMGVIAIVAVVIAAGIYYLHFKSVSGGDGRASTSGIPRRNSRGTHGKSVSARSRTLSAQRITRHSPKNISRYAVCFTVASGSDIVSHLMTNGLMSYFQFVRENGSAPPPWPNGATKDPREPAGVRRPATGGILCANYRSRPKVPDATGRFRGAQLGRRSEEWKKVYAGMGGYGRPIAC